MLHIILKIIIGIILFFAILYLVLNLLFLITSKEYRKWFWEESVRRAKANRKPKRSIEETDFYKRTGKRHFLDRDHRNDYKNYYGD